MVKSSSRGGKSNAAPGRTKSDDSLRDPSVKSHRSGDRSLDLSIDGGGGGGGLGPSTNVFDTIPTEYVKRPLEAEPVLHYLPKLVASHSAASSGGGGGSSSNKSSVAKFPNLRLLLASAEDDIRLHRARQQAGLNRDKTLLKTYKIETDQQWLARQQRLNERDLLLGKLDTERMVILKDLLQGTTTGLTAKEATAIQLARWQRALELYVYNPPQTKKNNMSAAAAGSNSGDDTGQSDKNVIPRNIDFLELLEKLMSTSAEEDDMSTTLSQAADMCATLVDVTKQITKDATESILEVEDSYQIRLESHELFCRNALARTEEIQNQFRINGRAALQIGNQLEFAESKRQRCESASILIRRWWLMESLAEQENMSGEPLKVQEEVRGSIPLASCRMDPLFTRPEKSLEASRALKQLRQVVKSRGNAASANMQTGQWEKADGTSSRRFDLTADLIQRTSEALEERLLNTFSDIFTRGGTYEFTTTTSMTAKQRAGVIAWQELRDIAQACWLFEGGRQLHQKYVEIVVATRLPELFDNSSIKKHGSTSKKVDAHRNPVVSSGGENQQEGGDGDPTSDEPEPEPEEEFDLDATRTQLSGLFHRVSEVFTQEFQLISYVFDYSNEAEGAITESIPLTVARALCARVIGDPRNGLQARINDLLDSIDRRSDFDTGAKKLDTFVVIHEKAAGLFELLKDSAERLIQDKSASSTAKNAVEALKVFLNSQEIALNNSHRHGYLNLELRLLHHQCCATLDQAGCMLMRPQPIKVDQALINKGILEEYRAPLLALDKDSLK
eukprot:CAMPEP_0113445046 /NCGR_PEP_ID=MMETSP0014_2-20120614/2982_1 /TAXON_ID=2857 /ORGANISM="Nitzschia sp." /LENGTH=787 /DNA_ID=CAMNT_0000336081 /DNA_START=345 /DNA_END=2705 /DNA_ORIENTATION=+ /assembly_acc=CAM_ASM_000159